MTDQTIEWLRGLAEKGGKGVVDARCLGRIADDLESMKKALQDLLYANTRVCERPDSLVAWAIYSKAEYNARAVLGAVSRSGESK